MKVTKKFRHGRTFHLWNRKRHYIGTVQDGDITLVVTRTWNRYKQRWAYDVYEEKDFYEMLEQYAER